MLYNLNDEYSRNKFAARIRFLWEKRGLVEVTDANKRSKKQNSYLHVCLGIISLETGYPLQVIKEHYKEQVCPDIYVSYKDDPILGKIKIVKSTTKINKETMSKSIDRLRNYASSELGIYIPSKEEKELLDEAERQIANASTFIYGEQ